MSLKRILIVDDEPHLIRSLSFILGKAGYETPTGRWRVQEHGKLVKPPSLLVLWLGGFNQFYGTPPCASAAP